MQKKYLDKLEYNKVLDIVSTYCITYLGKQYAISLVPSNNIDIVKLQLEETTSSLSFLFRKGEPPLFPIPNIEVWVKTLKSSNYLSAKALLEVANILKSSRVLHDYLFEDEDFDLTDFPLLADLFSSLYYNKNLENKILNSILDENTIADDASKTLSSLRRNRHKLEQDVRDKLANFIHSSSYSKYLMDSIVTIRSDRFAIPVKEEFKDNISGVILDVSASGSTVYIEPSAIFELNNKINGIKVQEALEIEKILRDLSLSLFPIADKLETSINAIGKIDFIFAKAKYARKINGICPNINTSKQIVLLGARHPLIEASSVVPIDISLGKDYSSLLITGPNTGGKTVTLKTVGLFCLMAYSGLLIPAKENSSLCVFDNVFADIGDEQSIQESLSTFSSHMLNIIDILKQASQNSLVLLDELGSGTDPLEGSSLAISILEHFYKIGALTICTTHYPELKKYALLHDGFENASSDFDVENLRPTYKLLIGIPGKSNAFAISKKLGLSDDILNRATSLIKEDDTNIEELLKNIYDDKLKVEQEKEKIQKNSNQIELLRKSLEKDNNKLKLEAENIIADAKAKARNILLDAKEEANEIIKDLNSKNINAGKANSLRNNINASIANLSDTNSNLKNASIGTQIDEKSLHIGQEVFCKKLNSVATILSLPNKSKEVKIQAGMLTLNVKLSDLLISPKNCLPNVSNNKNSSSSVSYSSNLTAKNVASEINVIGLNVDQAIPIVDKYLDECYMANLNNARIVHGKGTGKLRDGIHAFLKNHPHVKSFRIGTLGEGDMGVTIVYFS